MMRGEEGSEFEACHGFLSGRLLLLIGLLRRRCAGRLRAGMRQGNRGKSRRQCLVVAHSCVACRRPEYRRA
jgi:hypothetical protein